LVAEVLSDCHGNKWSHLAFDRGAIARRRNQHRALFSIITKGIFDEGADFSASLSDKANDDDIGIGVSGHL